MFLNLEKKYVNLPNGERYAYIEKGEGDKVVLLIHGNNASSIHAQAAPFSRSTQSHTSYTPQSSFLYLLVFLWVFFFVNHSV